MRPPLVNRQTPPCRHAGIVKCSSLHGYFPHALAIRYRGNWKKLVQGAEL